jgi:hypothetical protein
MKITEDAIKQMSEYFQEDLWDMLEEYTFDEKLDYLESIGRSYLKEYFELRPGALNMVIADTIHGLAK